MKLHIVFIAAICAAVALGDNGNWLDSYIAEEACPGMEKRSAAYESCVATMCTKYLNMARQRASKPSVGEGNAAMVKNAIDWSKHQGSVNKMYHQSIGSVKPGGNCGLRAENVAMPGKPDNPAARCIKMWINSSGHYTNMMGNYKYSACGIAVSAAGSYYCTQTFSNDCEGGAAQPIVTEAPVVIQTAPPTAPPRPIVVVPAAPTAPPKIIDFEPAPIAAPKPRPVVVATAAPGPVVVPMRPVTNAPAEPVRSKPMFKKVRVYKNGRRMTLYRVRRRGNWQYCSWFHRGHKCLSLEEAVALDKYLSKFFY